jgi:hypothetical protein
MSDLREARQRLEQLNGHERWHRDTMEYRFAELRARQEFRAAEEERKRTRGQLTAYGMLFILCVFTVAVIAGGL